MSVESRTESIRDVLVEHLPEAGRLAAAFAAEASESSLESIVDLSEEEIERVAFEYCSSVLPDGTDRAIDEFARTCSELDVAEEELSTLLVDLQAFLLETATAHEDHFDRRTLTIVGRDVTKAIVTFTRARVHSTGSTERRARSDPGAALRAKIGQIADRADEIESQTGQQASNMDQLSREVGDLSAAVEEIAASANEVNRQTDQAVDHAADGNRKARALSDRIDEVHVRASHVLETVEELLAHVEDVDTFVETIDRIADDTNMLALNASIEAARVDGGEGFAVVADEVKSLAGDSRAEAARIRDLVEAIEEAADRVTDDIDNVYGQTEAGREEAMAAIETFETIERINEQLSVSMDDVAAATDQQAQSTEELAMMAEEANRKASLILEEVTDIGEDTRLALESLESSATDRPDAPSSG